MGLTSGEIAHLGNFRGEELAWSPCEGQGMLNINFSVALIASTALIGDVEEIEDSEVSDAIVSMYGFGGDLIWRPSKC